MWRMLYESAARSAEVLALNVEDLDLASRRAQPQVHRSAPSCDPASQPSSSGGCEVEPGIHLEAEPP